MQTYICSRYVFHVSLFFLLTICLHLARMRERAIVASHLVCHSVVSFCRQQGILKADDFYSFIVLK